MLGSVNSVRTLFSSVVLSVSMATSNDTDFFSPISLSRLALVVAIFAMLTHGVPTRKVFATAAQRCGPSPADWKVVLS